MKTSWFKSVNRWRNKTDVFSSHLMYLIGQAYYFITSLQSVFWILFVIKFWNSITNWKFPSAQFDVSGAILWPLSDLEMKEVVPRNRVCRRICVEIFISNSFSSLHVWKNKAVLYFARALWHTDVDGINELLQCIAVLIQQLASLSILSPVAVFGHWGSRLETGFMILVFSSVF